MRLTLALLLSASIAHAAQTDAGLDPCRDFYEYACSSWIASNPIPPDRSSWDPYYVLAQQNAEQVKEILEAEVAPDAGDARKVSDDYASCMDQAAIEDAGIAPLQRELAAIDSQRTVDDSAKALAFAHKLQTGSVFALWVDPDPEDATKVIATIDVSSLGAGDRDYYLSTDPEKVKLREAYRSHVQRMLELSGQSTAQAKTHADDILAFETKLAQATPTREQRRDPKAQHHRMTASQVEALAPGFPWKSYFAALGIAMPSMLEVNSPEHLTAALKAWIALTPEQRKAYLRWAIVNELSAVLPARIDQEDFDFFGKTLRGKKEQEPRWKRCGKMTNFHLGELVGRVFVQKHFSESDRQRVTQLIAAIRAALRDDISTLQWMTPATRAEALARLDAYTIMVGHPDKWRDYSALEIRRGDAFGNEVRALRFDSARQLAKLGKPVDRTEWSSLPQEVDGYQNPTQLQVVFTAGILQPPFFDPKRDDAMNLGALGRAVGHEFTHGFDDHGRKFDRNGNLRDWWQPADAAAFEQRAQCFVDEYSKFVVVDDKTLNGKLTLGENIADNGGMRLAYAALKKQPPGKNIDGLTPEQRLFLAFAKTQCGKTTAETLRNRLLTDPHSPGKFRVNGTLANMPEFQQAFSCKAGDPMVNATRCQVW
ncbi:MAG: M13 family metallopeptidase [Myxococcaceae bacterium]